MSAETEHSTATPDREGDLLAVVDVARRINTMAENFEGWRRIGWQPNFLTDAERETLRDIHRELQLVIRRLDDVRRANGGAP